MKQLRGQSLCKSEHSMNSHFFCAPDESAIAFGETFPSNIYCLLSVICLGRTYLPSQPARNMKLASGPLDFILTYFSVLSEENPFLAVPSSVLEAAAVWSCQLAASPSACPWLLWDFFVPHSVAQPGGYSQPQQPSQDVWEAVFLCVCLLVVCTEVKYKVWCDTRLNLELDFLGNKTWKPLFPLHTGWSSLTD